MSTVRPEAVKSADARPLAVVAAAPRPEAVTFAADRVAVKASPAKPPAAEAPAEEEHGFLWNLFFGNTENKLFQIKVNLIYFKDLVMAAVAWLQAGPLGGVFTLFDKAGHFLTTTAARFQAAATSSEATLLEKALGWLGKAAGPVRGVLTVAAKWLEKTAPLFGWLTAVQDLTKAIKSTGDDKASTTKKALAWTTFGLSTIGSIASTGAAWGKVGALIAAATGLGAPALGAIAIACFAGSLLTGFLATRGEKKEPTPPAPPPAMPTRADAARKAAAARMKAAAPVAEAPKA